VAGPQFRWWWVGGDVNHHGDACGGHSRPLGNERSGSTASRCTSPQPIPLRGERGLQQGETQGDPTVPGPRTDGAAAEMVGGCQHRDRSPPRLRADGVKLGPAGPHLHRRMRERRKMSLGKWCPPGVHSTMVQPDQGPRLPGARSLGRVVRHFLRVGGH